MYDIRRKRFLHSAAAFPFGRRRQTGVVAERLISRQGFLRFTTKHALSWETKGSECGNVQKLNYGSPRTASCASRQHILCPPRQRAVCAEMFKNLTMDPSERLPALRDNTSFVPGDKGKCVRK